MSGRGPNIAVSVRGQLLNLARAGGVELEYLLNRYANERLLYRLARSPDANRFVLKGVILFALWTQASYRATRDLCLLPVPDDGIVFLPESVIGTEIREDEAYGGIRVTLTAMLSKARIPLQADIGFGDAVTPAAIEAELPTLLDFPRPRLQVYPRETVVAKKFEAMNALGIANSRMKDFYDLWRLSREFAFDGAVLSAAIGATFARRRTPLPTDVPTAVTPAFTGDEGKRRQWDAFVRRGGIAEPILPLVSVAETIQEFVLLPTHAVVAGRPFALLWPASGPWTGGENQG